MSQPHSASQIHTTRLRPGDGQLWHVVIASVNAFNTTTSAALGAVRHGKDFQHRSPNFSSQAGAGASGQIFRSC
ncbi:hypothetical protein ACFVW1_31015 [Streptomyces olivochromogenes]|uniref:hypothetical protein n=1 Tax=Streptomyces olivochromogenes TaxID=1963 RepID=UPI0036DE81A5